MREHIGWPNGEGDGIFAPAAARHHLMPDSKSKGMTDMPRLVMFTSEHGLLAACNSLKANYLFQQDKHYDVAYDTGDKAIQCGRHNDVFKIWLMWRAKGDAGFASQIDSLMEKSSYLQQQLREKEGFEFVFNEPEFINVCFWYVPKNMRDLPSGKERDEKLDKVAPKIKAMMMEKGSTMVGYQPLDEKPNFFRMIISNPAASYHDIDFLLKEIERLGEEL
ncbi:hypothetical protein LSH36_913g00015 [Paralvinella palmiformis]|uniref:Glutamate decarboxylase n=1 Tax=Paralvinella palmiformis TaxID=53620 RepID=A0AAD9IY91_9ANNE|nr:hypothetical protein LSH36_913g00015 [Paralvinella palmiformis]